jgi:hypothetical protein
MNIELKAEGFIAGKELSQFAKCCAAFELGTFMSHIRYVRIRLASVNEARDGKNKTCQVKIALSGRDKIIAEVLGSDLHVAIHQALERAGGAVARTLQRELSEASNLLITEQHLADHRVPDRAA